MASGPRTLTIAAVGFLGLDGVLFLWLGRAVGRSGFLWAGAACITVAGIVVLAAREQERRVAAIRREQEALKAAAEDLQRLVNRR